MKKIVGCADVRKVAMANGDVQEVRVKPSDDGGMRLVRLTLSANSYPADLTPEEARHIGQALIDAAGYKDAKTP